MSGIVHAVSGDWRKRLSELEKLQNALKSAEGQLILKELALICGAERSCKRGTDGETNYACGLRDAYLELRSRLEFDVLAAQKEMEKIQ